MPANRPRDVPDPDDVPLRALSAFLLERVSFFMPLGACHHWCPRRVTHASSDTGGC